MFNAIANDSEYVVVRVQVRGKVRGVGYKTWMRRTATELGVAGWVRSWRDGSIEAVLGGPEGRVKTLIARCRSGPRGAHVAEFEQEVWTGARPADGFEIVGE